MRPEQRKSASPCGLPNSSSSAAQKTARHSCRKKQAADIDLPLKAVVWEDADGKTWLSYNEPGWVASRHGLDADTGPTTDVLAASHREVVRRATTAAPRRERPARASTEQACYLMRPSAPTKGSLADR
jgi:hypothetical protein